MTTLPFTFYWSDETETTFDPSTMNVFDENIFSFDMRHDEGQVPTLDLIVKNPRIGLLNPGRKVWAWLGYQSESGLVPIFFGVLVGVPTSLFLEKVTLKFIARSPQFIANKQALAETMRTAPYYDPIWLDPGKRDDPDSILEGWSALWHIDRTTLAITASDILEGEDGTITFYEDDAFYSSVSLELGQAPLTNIRVEGTVNWQQRASGYVTMPDVNISSYTGDSLISDWPKAGGNIGGGYKCETSYVTDTFLISRTPNSSWSSSWTNTDPDPGQCGNSSASQSASGPALLAPNPLTNTTAELYVTGICDPYSDPPVNRPASSSVSGVIIPLWNVGMKMTMRYDASRQFSEQVSFDLIANTQGILSSPTVAQHTETLAVSSVDIGQPLIEVDAWTDFAGQAVELAQIIFPNNPTKPGGLSYQIAVVAGTAGEVEPNFSDLPGITTADGSVLWASFGKSGLTSASDWTAAAYVPLGQIINLQDQVFRAVDGAFEKIPGRTSYYLCTRAGQTNAEYRDFSYTPTVQSNIEGTPAIRHMSVIDPPTFSTTAGDHIIDGDVTWTVLGTSPAHMGIPIGGSPDTVTARQFFPTARGLQSIEYLISRARARLRLRARAVTIGWECRFEDALGLSCRHNATLFDPRFPGGAATGKVISYVLSASGNGTIKGHVEIGCSVGYGESIVEITGTPEYAAPGYMQADYQIYDGAMVAHGSNDVTYSVPSFQGFDDGLSFPLRWQDISDGGFVSGSLAEQKAAIVASFPVALELIYHMSFYNMNTTLGTSGGFRDVKPVKEGFDTVTGSTPDFAWKVEQEALALASQDTPYIMAANPISWSCLLKPCAGNGPFNGSYAIDVSPLSVPQGINLEAPSSP